MVCTLLVVQNPHDVFHHSIAHQCTLQVSCILWCVHFIWHSVAATIQKVVVLELLAHFSTLLQTYWLAGFLWSKDENKTSFLKKHIDLLSVSKFTRQSIHKKGEFSQSRDTAQNSELGLALVKCNQCSARYVYILRAQTGWKFSFFIEPHVWHRLCFYWYAIVKNVKFKEKMVLL